MATDSGMGYVELWEDFTRDNVENLVETVASTGTQDIRNKHGGWWRQYMTATDTDAAMIAGELAFEADSGSPLVFETRLLVTDVDVASVFVGMSDANSETEALVFEDEGGDLNSIATDAFGFMLEGEQTTVPVQAWQAVAVDTNVDETQTVVPFSGAVDSVIQTLRLEANPNNSGEVLYFVDGKLQLTKTSWFDSSIVYCPAVDCDARNTAYYTDYDYIYCRAPRS